MSIGFTEVLLILVVILLLFGGKRIPELAKAFGRASFEYKKAKEILKKEAQEFSDAVDGCVEKEEATNNAEKN
ncbi:MAG: twin-arginine translocase TatA/TatE family subunit [Candidatus Melainabacteria bacterium]|nr:MAG: twin-arginine translocase TatA/TatE family subunit [Candidatus Melainabacteria bacterium]